MRALLSSERKVFIARAGKFHFSRFSISTTHRVILIQLTEKFPRCFSAVIFRVKSLGEFWFGGRLSIVNVHDRRTGGKLVELS